MWRTRYMLMLFIFEVSILYIMLTSILLSTCNNEIQFISQLKAPLQLMANCNSNAKSFSFEAFPKIYVIQWIDFLITMHMKRIKSPWSSKQSVGLLVAKVWLHIPGQSSKMKYKKKIFLRRLHLSRYLAKTLRVNKPAMV